jgi:hypothetical protein
MEERRAKKLNHQGSRGQHTGDGSERCPEKWHPLVWMPRPYGLLMGRAEEPVERKEGAERVTWEGQD